MHRFFITPEQFEAEKPVVRGPDVRHMVKVLRLGPGDVVDFLDGTGRALRARIDRVGKDEVFFSRLDEYKPGGEPPVKVTLVQGLAKGDKMDLVIQKSTELGVAEIIPMICHRSVVRLNDKKSLEKQQRWQRVALEAAKQCRRARVPVVLPPQGLDEVLDGMPEGTASFLPWEREHNHSFRQMLERGRPGRVYIFIGPEGGFEEYEVERARQKGVVTVTLGPRILRTETAGIVSLTLVMHAWGDVG